jgi:hypothetical protein
MREEIITLPAIAIDVCE